jgi:hypothetical protein
MIYTFSQLAATKFPEVFLSDFTPLKSAVRTQHCVAGSAFGTTRTRNNGHEKMLLPVLKINTN